MRACISDWESDSGKGLEEAGLNVREEGQERLGKKEIEIEINGEREIDTGVRS